MGSLDFLDFRREAAGSKIAGFGWGLRDPDIGLSRSFRLRVKG